MKGAGKKHGCMCSPHPKLKKNSIKKSNRKSIKKSIKNIIKKGGRKKQSYRCPYDKVVIKKSNKSAKKKMAVFTNSNTGRKKTTHFGAFGMSDYTKHKDKARKSRYLARHKKRENWNDCSTAGALSRWILWGETSLSASIKKFKNKFKLK